jgi:lipid II:glycine glycyltransferase (peptidoglycan interpeptide bridge formation enzyme)
MNIQIEIVNDQLIWDTFVKESPNSNFMQSWNWSQYQSEGLGKKIFRLGFYNNQELVGLALCYEMNQTFGKYIYCMRGPILKDLNEDLYKEVLQSLTSYFKDSEYIFIKIDPAIKESDSISTKPLSLGFTKCINYVQPETPWFQDLVPGGEEELLAWCKEHGMSKNYSTYIRKARKEGLTVRFSKDIKDWESFTNYLSKSSSEKHFAIHDPQYYTKQFKYMGQEDMVRLAVVQLDGDPIAMLILSYFGQEVSCLYSAQTGMHTKMRGPMLLRWECMLDAQARGFKKFNSWNVLSDDKYKPSSSQYGYSNFKRGFGGYLVTYQRTMDYPLSKKYLLVKALDLYRRVRYYRDR